MFNVNHNNNNNNNNSGNSLENDDLNRILTNNEEFLNQLKLNNEFFIDENIDDDVEDENGGGLKGLTGLNNLGNTCYLNSALQALLNCPSLTNYFLECGSYIRPTKQPHIALSYMKLVKDTWLSYRNKKRSLSPNEIVFAIKSINPMFKGYMQQDTQEFLICFLEQLNEELKQLNILNNIKSSQFDYLLNEDSREVVKSMDVQQPPSAGEDTDSYETCDSSSVLSTDEKHFLSKYETVSRDTGPAIVFSYEKDEKPSNDQTSTVSSDSGISVKTTDRKLNENEVEEVDVDEAGDRVPVAQVVKDAKKRGNNNFELDINLYKKLKKSYTSIISDIFDGKLISQVQCLNCERVSNTIETFQDLSLPIPTKEYLQSLQNKQVKQTAEATQSQGWLSWMYGYVKGSLTWGPTISLEDCFQAYFTAADLKGDNMYSCDKCKKLSDGIKYSRLLSLPETLYIQLKRFRHDYQYSTKMSQYVSFPLTNLDLKDYVHKECKNETSVYDLSAIICHHGGSNTGHYTCYAYNYLYDQWYEYDDCSCVQVDETIVKNAQAYVLFYRKRNPLIQQIHRELATFCLKNEVSKAYYISKKWIHKLKYFSEPGPITNHDFLCPHGDVNPSYWSSIDDLVVPITENLWNYLNSKFTSDAPCTSLNSCEKCYKEMKSLHEKRLHEKETYIKLQERQRDLMNSNELSVSSLCFYAISANWFKDWETFVLGKTAEPPGPINNLNIAQKKNGEYELNKKSNHHDVNSDVWSFLYDIYGGGPILCKYNGNKLSDSLAAKKSTPQSTSFPNLKSSPQTNKPPGQIMNRQQKSILQIASTSQSNHKRSSSSSSSSIYDDCTDNVTLITTPQNFIKVTNNTNEDVFQIQETRIN